MQKQTVIDILSAHAQELRSCGLKSVALFGSTARDEAAPDSDIDLLVEFDGSIGMFRYLRVRRYLSGLLGADIDLVTHAALRSEMKDSILQEAVDVTPFMADSVE